ncbi:hypothetical protein [Actinopolymorpha alba]|uniref:hypothetical protein n=1 Tax=Actinopolymorpha alba TaxID=533267 RepID=UPI00037F34EC|nr:hypothetical protein [Actinopolymorpha alba]
MSERKPPGEGDKPSRGMPTWPSGEGDAAPSPTEKPRVVMIAVLLMYFGAALSAVGALSVFWYRDELRAGARRALQQQDKRATPEAVESFATNAMTLILVFGLIAIAIWVFMALMNDRGKGWARLTATGLAVANVVYSLQTLSILSLASVLVGIVAAGLLWTPAARQWFDGAQRSRV